VIALVNSSFAQLTSASQSTTDTRNLSGGVASRRADAERNSEWLIDIGAGKTMSRFATP